MSRWRGDARVLLIAADRALLFLGSGRGLRHAYEFAAGDSGWAAFANYLEGAPPTPLYVLVDVVEEEYRQDTIPHVRGKDRASVLTRKYARLFRGTPYCLALDQGREREGRRDDRVLLTALTKPDTLTPWITELVNHRVPLAGIYSLPVLSHGLLKQVRATASNVLFISVQQASGLRQTFYRDGQLKISRLAQMPRLGSVPYATYVLAELAKLRRYLNSLALVSRESPLAIYILSHGRAARGTRTALSQLGRRAVLPGRQCRTRCPPRVAGHRGIAVCRSPSSRSCCSTPRPRCITRNGMKRISTICTRRNSAWWRRACCC